MGIAQWIATPPRPRIRATSKCVYKNEGLVGLGQTINEKDLTIRHSLLLKKQQAASSCAVNQRFASLEAFRCAFFIFFYCDLRLSAGSSEINPPLPPPAPQQGGVSWKSEPPGPQLKLLFVGIGEKKPWVVFTH